MHWPKPLCFHSKLINAHIDRTYKYALNYAWKIKLQNATQKKLQNNNKKEIADKDNSCDMCIYSSPIYYIYR